MGEISSGISLKATSYISFFDLDRTIIRSNSGEALIRHAYKNGYLSSAGLARSIYLSLLYKYNLRDTVEIITALAFWLKGLPEPELSDIAKEIFSNQLKGDIRPGIVNEIEMHKTAGGKSVILSSALRPVCREVADHLGIDDIICSDLESENGILTGRPAGTFCFGEEKLKRIREYCEINNTSLSGSWYYSDSHSDMPVLESVGNPVCVSPDRKLMKEAGLRGWKII
jgi:putative phosphoserine phosphatase/1-acylglycerol-3-phosphate O-acyltransferase